MISISIFHNTVEILIYSATDQAKSVASTEVHGQFLSFILSKIKTQTGNRYSILSNYFFRENPFMYTYVILFIFILKLKNLNSAKLDFVLSIFSINKTCALYLIFKHLILLAVEKYHKGGCLALT